ncbi:bifunctional glutamate N-acetyltransferase/amino-acid acetyltransferase ArgJ [Lactiplantibacillus mudanjiangensis]|uniref:Arginine biosynthesis bifunctional protein ArgJ n=1 Tax=Lactiplantibacillus mudanjiangensis TaxID=1296538 RepID=A0A660E7E2_9LACO|nr:bifunctional glutamate N-acetyltransferase/amino-acid acetyltransferase ArgJ [Lactiplantibacillus mudanjiangensis]VDG21441.1 bifunctional ornithine acetyltransferase/N-acetylglutamate synthase protein [Lactobacillus plantarum JDM1] [Lactiplantibacillus mudanjiangensis]VDG26124.1 bifunctional ornithine acetyltransferase/N-acetylglutamate synthase protein [Lactobacillus plantarum JDM1] [Lactiplantibacillus mudanjiangensis]VDG29037.1 bifunctional ornithine acetyltransferase/N-acetylglutamate syn
MQVLTKSFQKVAFQWPEGFYSDGIHIGLRRQKKDFGWLFSKVPAAAAGTYTTNQFQAAPTKLTKAMIDQDHQLQGLLLNSAVANSCTGQQGWDNAVQEQTWLANKLAVDPSLIGVASTGLIGAQLPMDVIKNGLPQLTPTKSDAVTYAVLTTDKQPKTICVQCELSGHLVTITGFAKGSGMIHPKMATMLGFITTDAQIAGEDLQALLSDQVDETFNQITVDGDTSTNDMVVTMANGLAENPNLTPDTADYATFAAAFHTVLGELAKQIAADGEGATKLVECNVWHAASEADGQQVAKAIVGSNLVKAAIFGEDPNWGRIISTIGATPADLDIDHVNISMNGLPLVADSLALPFDEATVKATLGQSKITIDVDLQHGDASGQAWGCDLTYNYVKINASYHT